MKIYNRELECYEENVQYGGVLLNILYNNSVGRILLKVAINPVFSKIGGWYNDTGLSKGRIKPFIKKNGIIMDDFEEKEYENFNSFFSRKIKEGRRPVDMSEESFVSPADSKLSVYDISEDNLVNIKGTNYKLSHLVGDKVNMEDYQGGKCLVFRLSVDDYHRYIFPDYGRVTKRYSIKGKLHTVSSISKDYKIYKENSRVVNVMKTENFGKVICIEVGALLVGKIVNHPIRAFEKGMEKGYFKLGGSTVVMLLQKDKVELDEDIIDVTSRGIEVKIRMGERIGRKVKC